MGNLKDIKDSLTRLVRLYLESTKLTIIEGLTIFIGGLMLVTFALVCIIIFLMFISFGVAEELRLIMSPGLAYLTVAAIWLIILAVVVLLRNQILYDPLVRFISRLILNRSNKLSQQKNEAEQDEEE